MIYFIHGTDIDKARVKVYDLVGSLQKKKPEASFFKMDVEYFDANLLQEYIGGQGLFENKYIVLLDRLCGDKKIKDEVLDRLKEISQSHNIFIFLEGKLDKATVTKIEKKSEKSQDFELQNKSEKEFYNAFALADALAQRDKKNLWILYRKAIDKGEAPEALQGMLFWKVKTMLLSSNFGVYKKEELDNLADQLISVYHDSRRGKHELETGLESLILSL
ncbi:MAG: hypothetical protein AAB917_00125 [Patescibacteria group bacterium]